MTITPRFITRIKPMNGITPFTYRDGLTYLQVLERIIEYIQTHLIAELNEVIETLNIQGDELVQQFQELYDQAQQEIADLIESNTGTIEALADAVNAQIAVVEDMQTTLVDYYGVTTEAIDTRMQELDVKIAEINALLVVLQDKLSAPPTQVVNLGPGANLQDLPEHWAGFPVEYELHQDATGGRTITFPETVTGNVPLDPTPGSVTRMRLIPNGAGAWKVDPIFTATHRHMVWQPSNDVQMLDTASRYCAYVVAENIGNTVVYSYTRSDNHYGGNQQLVIRQSTDGGKTFTPGTALPYDPGDPQFGISGISTAPWGFIAIGIHSNPRRMFFLESADGKTWTTKGLISNAFPTDIIWIDTGTPDGKIIATDYRAAGVYLWESTDRGNTWGLGYVFPQMSGNFVAPISETSILDLGGGELLLCTRYDPNVEMTTQHFMFSRSYDYGESWTPLVALIENVTGHPRMKMMPNGDIVTPLRCGTQSVKGVNGQWGYALSKDKGRTWTQHYEGLPYQFQTYGMYVITPDDRVTLYGSFQNGLSVSHVFRTEVLPTLSAHTDDWDTGWLPLPLVEGREALTSCRYRRVGKTVYLRGIIDVGNGVGLGPVSLFNTLERWALPEMDVTVPVSGEATTDELAQGALQVLTSGWGQLVRVGGPASSITSRYVRLNGVSYPVK